HTRCRQGDGEQLRCVSTRPVGGCVDIKRATPSRRSWQQRFRCPGLAYAPWPLPWWRDPYYTHSFPQWTGMESPVAAEKASGTAPGRRPPADNEFVLSTYVPDAHFVRELDLTTDELIRRSEPEVARSRDGPGATARFAGPTGIAIDSHGNVF